MRADRPRRLGGVPDALCPDRRRWQSAGRLRRGHAGRSQRCSTATSTQLGRSCRSAATTAPSSWRTGSTSTTRCWCAWCSTTTRSRACATSAAGRASGPARRGPSRWLEVEGAPVSLNDIEHRILRPIWQDPRVLYALSCAALGCPSLQPEPFRAERLEQQLERGGDGLRQRPALHPDRRTSALEVSSLFRWYQADFGGSERAIINHLMAYAEPAARDAAAEVRPDHRRRLRLASQRRRALTRAAAVAARGCPL